VVVPGNRRALAINPWRGFHRTADDHGCKVGSTATASNYGGPKHPQWYYNLKAHPECELGGERFLATEITESDDYARVYGLAEQVYAGWSDYRLKTDPIGRRIPVFRLTPR
jgi:deazaflavin-dependent oxidoreductase (nitroreductase family)